MTDKKRNILQEAISDLPKFRAPEKVQWIVLERRLQKGTLSEQIRKLPVFKAPAKVWLAVEKELDHNQTKVSSSKKLPVYKAPGDLWSSIESRLPAANESKSIGLKIWWQVAASIVLLLGVTFFITRIDSIQLAENKEKATSQEPGIENLISPSLCAHNPQVCSKPVYKELNTQLEEVSRELEHMETLLDQHNDPQMLKYYYRLQNEQAEIQKQLMKLILET